MKTILFDFGNVIAFFDHTRATRKFAKYSGMPQEKMYSLIYDTELEYDFEAGRLSVPEFVRKAKAVIGYRGTDKEFEAAFIDIFTANDPVCTLIPRLKQRYRLVLASNTNRLHFGHYRGLFRDVLSQFDGIGVSFEAGARKPHPDFFAHCQRMTAADPNECLFIDDMATNVEGAEKFGWHGVLYTSPEELVHRLRGHDVDI